MTPIRPCGTQFTSMVILVAHVPAKLQPEEGLPSPRRDIARVVVPRVVGSDGRAARSIPPLESCCRHFRSTLPPPLPLEVPLLEGPMPEGSASPDSTSLPFRSRPQPTVDGHRRRDAKARDVMRWIASASAWGSGAAGVQP